MPGPIRSALAWMLVSSLLIGPARAGVGDPQIRTEHPWYPGELALSTFDRLFATQAEAFRHVTGRRPETDQDKALAAWLWRNTHYWHGEEGAEDLWGKGFTAGGDLRGREYWTGMFAHGFGLCGTTHAQWIGEINALLGHNRGRDLGVQDHNSFEVFLTGGPHGQGRWVLLDHDTSTVIFSEDGKRLLSIPEVMADRARLTDRGFKPARQHGWPVCGLHPDDGVAYARYNTAEYLAGYAGVPPLVHLRRGEALRRYLRPGLDDGGTFVFWGRNSNTDGIPGPERSRTWVNQPEALHGGTTKGAGYHPGQARFANAVYTYRPDWSSGDYREGIVSEGVDAVTFAFYTPYIIAATPADDSPWGIYEGGCRNGLVLRGRADCPVAVSTDQGATWQDRGPFRDKMDLTDRVKGHRQYFLRLGAGAKALKDSGLTIRTVCQANSSILPRLTDGGGRVSFLASGRAVVSAGPNLDQGQSHVVAGAFGTPDVTLEIAAPHGETAVAVNAAAHFLSGNPLNPKTTYRIDYSTDRRQTWAPLVEDWRITRRGQEPADFWSQSFCWGSASLRTGGKTRPTSVLVRFRDDGGRAIERAEVHLVHDIARRDPARVTFDWTDADGGRRASRVFPAAPGRDEPQTWEVPTGRDVRTNWVEFEPAPEA